MNVSDIPSEFGYAVVQYYDEAPQAGSHPTDAFTQASELTARIAPTHGPSIAVRTVLPRNQLSSYAVVRMQSVLSMVWTRPFFEGPNARHGRHSFVTLRYV